MKILAIETSMGRSSVAVTTGSSDEPVRVAWLHAGEPQAEKLVPLIGELMAKAALSFHALDLIAVCVGPGGFSGIRTGVAAARGIALAANVPIVGTTSFRIMAAGLFEAAWGICLKILRPCRACGLQHGLLPSCRGHSE